MYSGVSTTRRGAVAVVVRPPGIAGQPLDSSVPADIRKVTEGNLHGWLRLRRFQILMTFPTLTTAAAYLKVRPSALTGQFNRLEVDLAAELFHRSVRHSAQHPTRRGASLLRDVNDPQVQNLMCEALGPKFEPMPSRAEIESAEAVADGMDARLPPWILTYQHSLTFISRRP
ncbi:LysR family transcriptional regulator [Streptomyces sp. NPDC050421]|uniref:helix-turn-helix domain-containing protein n=1 Tax=unclassified Streptomyces TaxID=2593676 RepID=UPI0037A4B54E